MGGGSDWGWALSSGFLFIQSKKNWGQEVRQGLVYPVYQGCFDPSWTLGDTFDYNTRGGLKSLMALTLGQSNQILLMILKKLKVPLMSGKEHTVF